MHTLGYPFNSAASGKRGFLSFALRLNPIDLRASVNGEILWDFSIQGTYKGQNSGPTR